MSTSDRQILTPGETAQPAAAPAAEAPSAPAPECKKTGPVPGARAARAAAAPAAAPADDDLAEFDTDELPPASVALPAAAAEFTPEQQRLIAAMIASAVGAAKSAQDPQTAAKLAAKANTAERLPSQAEAAAMCEDAIARSNARPRPILTPDGWYVHPESVRTVDHGVAKLQVG